MEKIYLEKLKRILEYKAYTLKLLSIIDYDELADWTINIDGVKKHVKLPYTIDRDTILFKRDVYIRSLYEMDPRLVVRGDIDALLYIDDELYSGIDLYTDYIPLRRLKPGRHFFKLDISKRNILGRIYEKPRIESITILYIHPVIDSFADETKWLIELSGATGDPDFRREALSLLEDTYADIWIPTPSPKHLLLLRLFRDYPSRYRYLYDELQYLAEKETDKLVEAGYGRIDYDKLVEAVSNARAKLYEGLKELRQKYPKKGRILAWANSHLDTAWLWTPEETVFKLIRNTAKILRLLEEYGKPVYLFSSAQYLEWLRKHQPNLFNKVKKYVRNGRIIPATSTWVENDTMIIPSEALVRQFLYGIKYSISALGVKPRIYWLPDSFGYSANLPQILREAGIELFVGYKTKWNQYNPIPYKTFIWRGIDGSEIPAHLLIGTYTHKADPGSLLNMWRNNTEKEVIEETIYAYGYGDGGGGPNVEMIKKLEFYDKTPKTPYIIHGGLDEYLRNLRENKNMLPRWTGELYVEEHRGTYTTNTGIKKRVWILEYLLRTLESLHAILGESIYLEDYWKKLLLATFHDILPGSSTHSVYHYMYGILDEAIKDVEEMIRDKICFEQGYIIYNPTQWYRREIVEVDEEYGEIQQESYNGRGLLLVDVKPYSLSRIEDVGVKPGSDLKAYTIDGSIVLENKYLELIVNPVKGSIGMLVDKEDGFRYLVEGSNIIAVHDDTPHEWDAWDIDEYSLKHYYVLKPKMAEIVENGPLRATVRLDYRFMNTRIQQYISLTSSSRRIAFKVYADIRDRHILVKNWFRTRINSFEAFFETPYGVVKRTIHSNTSWEWARYEQPFLNWFAVEDGGYGLAFVSPVKHGVSIKPGEIGLSLIRAPLIPDPLSDSGRIGFEYYIVPYRGSWVNSGVHIEAEKIVNPLHVSKCDDRRSSLGKNISVKIDRVELVVKSIKPAEDGGGIVLRIFNYSGRSGTARIRFNTSVEEAYRVNILEEPLYKLRVVDNTVFYVFKPYEIASIMVKLFR